MSSPAVVIAPDEPVKRALAVLDRRRFTALPVVGDDGRLVGVVSEADLLRDRFPPDPRIPIADRRERALAITTGDVMTREVLTARPDDVVADLLAVLQATGHRFVPVVGVITYRDLVHAIARDDTQIAADVARRLAIHAGPGRWQVRVRDGEVTLSGRPADAADRSVATRLAESVVGVIRCGFAG